MSQALSQAKFIMVKKEETRAVSKLMKALFFAMLVLPLLDVIPAGAQGPMDEIDMQIQEMKKKKEKEFLGVTDPKDIPPFKMVLVKGGCFDMGDFTGVGDDDEVPVHRACLTDFYLGETEVTQKLFEAITGYNPSRLKGPDLPVTNVSYHNARQFVIRLNELTKGFYRLPTEAEWEYAARSGGKKEKWSGLNNEGELGDYAWFVDNSANDPHPVKAKKPNGLGLYDMSGNVWEWTEDYFDFDYYKVSPEKDPMGPDMSYWKVVRGGSFAENPIKLRTPYRYAMEPDRTHSAFGFRLAE